MPAHEAHEENLGALAVAHYATGGLAGLFSCVFIVNIAAGVMMSRGESSTGKVLVVAGLVALLLGSSTSAATVYAGRCIARRRHHRYCMIVAALWCVWIPLGTALGVFTLIVLNRPPVRALFEGAPERVDPSNVAAAADSSGLMTPAAKRRFSRDAWLLGGGLALAQVALLVVFFGYAFFGSLHAPLAFVDPASALQTGDRIWFVENTRDGIAGQPKWVLASVSANGDDAPVSGAILPEGSRYLAADNYGIWVLGGHAIARYEAGVVTARYPTSALYWPSRPFTYDGGAAVFDWCCGHEIRMKRPGAGGWRDVPGETWKASPSMPKLPDTWAVLPAGLGFDVFVQFGDELRWRHIVTGDDLGDPHQWAPVGSADAWAALRVADESIIAQAVRRGPFDTRIVLLHRAETGWVPTATIPVEILRTFGALPSAPGAIRLAIANPGRLATLDVDVSGGQVRSKHVHDTKGQPRYSLRFWAAQMVTSFLLSLCAAAILTALLRRKPVDVFAAQGQSVRLASLLQRGLARGIDYGLQSAICLPWALPLWRVYDGETSPAKVFRLCIAIFGISLLGIVVLSWTEGRWGTSPGKLLVGVKVVGTDLAPCGFWRGVVRNALRVIDEAFGFSVGMLVAALTGNRQRIGDVAAKTLVVRNAKRLWGGA